MPPTFICAIHFDYVTSHENKFKLFNFIIFFSMHKTLEKLMTFQILRVASTKMTVF
jgi:hypothetical protein